MRGLFEIGAQHFVLNEFNKIVKYFLYQYFSSFGQTAIFLLGGRTKEEQPSAMFLKSGDVVVILLILHESVEILEKFQRFYHLITVSAYYK